jgi:hypothetical protein
MANGMRALGGAGDVAGVNAMAGMGNYQTSQATNATARAQEMLKVLGPLATRLKKIDPQRLPEVYAGVAQQVHGMFPEAGVPLQYGPDVPGLLESVEQMWQSQQTSATPPTYDIKQNAQGEYIQIPKIPGTGTNYSTGVYGTPNKGTEVSVNIADNKGNVKLAEVMAQKQGDALAGYMDKATAASEQRNGLNAQRTLIEQGLQTGSIQPMLQGISRFVSDMGVDPTTLKLPDPAKGEAFNQASFNSLLIALAAQKGPQTEGDAQRALKTFAGMQNTEQGNMFIIDYLESVADRTEQMADFIFDKATNKYAGDPKGVYKAEKDFRAWARQTPIVAKSPNSGLPVTYSQFKTNAESKGLNPEQIDGAWRSFAKGQ